MKDAGNLELPFDAPERAPAELADAPALLAALDAWAARGWLRPLDRAFAGFLAECEPGLDPLVLLAGALASHQLGHGHVCIDLALLLERPDEALSLPPEGDTAQAARLPSEVLAGVGLDGWLRALRASVLVCAAAGNDDARGRAAPMVLAGQRLYLRRYWNYERQVAHALRQRLAQAQAWTAAQTAALKDALAVLFGDPGDAVDWQRLACAVAARASIAIVTGGPGTGKTTTVVRLLALLQMEALARGARPLRIMLAAPTGKAAARLSASIAEQTSRLDVADAVRAAIPTQATTLHRLLGSRPGTRRLRHHAGEPLLLDMLVVDEASMIDLEMMASLTDALPAHARLVLLGDKDQLASVEAGAVLGDLCRDAQAGRYDPATQAWLEAVGGVSLAGQGLEPGDAGRHALAQQTVMLRHSRRFGPDSGIGQLAAAVNAGDAPGARAILLEARDSAGLFDLRAPRGDELDRLLLDGHDAGPRGHAHYLEVLRSSRPAADLPPGDAAWEDWARRVLEAFDRFRPLCALRKGEHGVEGINARIARALVARGLIPAAEGWYEGRPVLVTRNDYGLGLMNGDIGIALEMPQAAGRDEDAGQGRRLRVAFARSDGAPGIRFVLPSRLGSVETVYTMTVHKSQGSEFDHAALLLPERASPILTRELAYTAITRARRWFTLVEAGAGVFEETVARRVRRVSGLEI